MPDGSLEIAATTADATPTLPPGWAARIAKLQLRTLLIEFTLEAAEHRRIVFDRNAKFPESWRDFRQFLLLLGPAPGEHYRVMPTVGEKGYDQRSRWEHKSAKRQAQPNPASRQSSPDATYSQWTMMAGKPIEYTTLSRTLNVPFENMAVALNAGRSPDEIVQQSSVATTMSLQMDWFSSDQQRQDAFRGAYRAWHMKVEGRFSGAATPKFLYLYILLPEMIRCKATLLEADLWDPLSERHRSMRDASPAWKRYCELFPKAQVAVQEMDIYRQYSLTSQLEDLWTRVETAEKRFRGVKLPPAPITKPR
jgi:hypothetical protein